MKKLSDFEVDKKVVLVRTQYDRKRKLSDRNIETIKRNLAKGKTITDMARRYKVTSHTVRYNIDEVYRLASIMCRTGAHYGVTNCDFTDRVLYKRKLLKNSTYRKKYLKAGV